MSKYNLRSNLGGGRLDKKTKLYSDLLAYSDGKKDLHQLSKIIKSNHSDLLKMSKKLIKLKLLKTIN